MPPRVNPFPEPAEDIFIVVVVPALEFKVAVPRFLVVDPAVKLLILEAVAVAPESTIKISL